MRTSLLPGRLGRAVGLGVASLGIMVGVAPSGGCLLPDYCISIGITGTHMCLIFSNASGVDDEGQLVPTISDGVGLIQGCACLFDSEVEILGAADPTSVPYQEIMFRMEADARQVCLELAIEQGLIEHNCLSADIEGGLINGLDSCVAGCVYTKPPPGGECPDTCSPDDNASGETGASETNSPDEDGTETGQEPPAGPLVRMDDTP